MKNKILGGIMVLFVAALIISVIYLLALLGKTISYKVWYEDQVQQTVKEMVDQKYLIKKEK